MPAYNQFQTFYPTGNPYSVDPAQMLSNNIYESTNRINSNVNESQRFLTAELAGVNTNIYDNTNRVNSNVTEAQRFLTAEIAGVNKNIYDTIAQNGIAIERTSANGMATTERTAANGMATTERVNSQLATAVERNGANGMNTTERTAGQVSSAVERTAGQVGASVERNGGNITTTIERVAGEGRLTTTITDAASRQAANDSARDILRAVDRVGVEAVGTTKDGFSGVLASVERNAGEGRVQTLQSNGQLSSSLLDVRHSILNDVNRSANDILTSNTQNLNVLTKHVTDGAWESRSAMAVGFQTLSEEHLRTKHDLAQQASTYYSSNLLEGQKNQAHLAQQASTYYSSNLLEQQKSTALLANKQDNQFAALLLEQQKSKECLTLQLQDAKYEALKNKCDLSKELAECCCEIKMKVDQRGQDVINTVDTLDRNRLRDEVNTINNENTILKLLDYGDYGRGRRHSRSPDHRRR
jgi:hypothetical protein